MKEHPNPLFNFNGDKHNYEEQRAVCEVIKPCARARFYRLYLYFLYLFNVTIESVCVSDVGGIMHEAKAILCLAVNDADGVRCAVDGAVTLHEDTVIAKLRKIERIMRHLLLHRILANHFAFNHSPCAAALYTQRQESNKDKPCERTHYVRES